MRENVDLSYINRIAVIPFDNNSHDQFAGARLRDITSTNILALGLFDVIDKSAIDSALIEEAVEDPGAIDNATMKRIAQRLGVQGFMFGSVDYAGLNRKGSVSFPEVSLTLRLVEANSGAVLWQSSGSRDGDSFGKRLFGLNPNDQYTVSSGLIKEMLETIFQTAPTQPKNEKQS